MNNNFILASLSTLILLILCCFSQYGGAIQCYVCNSGAMYDPEGICGNIAGHSLASTKVANCSALPARDGHPWERCRVIYQDVEGESRIIRSCATHPDKTKENRCIDRTGTYKIKIRYCECNTDLCNGVSFNTPSILVLSSFAALAAFSSKLN